MIYLNLINLKKKKEPKITPNKPGAPGWQLMPIKRKRVVPKPGAQDRQQLLVFQVRQILIRLHKYWGGGFNANKC
jgi:translation initiation factor IF-2